MDAQRAVERQRKRLCVILGGHFENALGGAEYQAKCIVEEILRHKDVELFYLARDVSDVHPQSGYEVIEISKSNKITRYGFYFDILKLFRLLKKIDPDVIYQRALKSYTGVAAYYAKRYKRQMVYHVALDADVMPVRLHSVSDAPKYLDRKIGEYGIRNASAIITQTEFQARCLKKYYNRNADAVVYNFHPAPQEAINKSQPPKVVWVANFKPSKRPELFVRLAKDLQGKISAEFVMVGKAGNPRQYGELINSIGELNNLHYLGAQPIEEVNRLLAESTVFVNTSTKEGFPNTFIQAWMRKAAVVSVDIDPDQVLQRMGIGIVAGSYANLKKGVLRLLQDANQYSEITDRAYQYVLTRHSTKNVYPLLELLGL